MAETFPEDLAGVLTDVVGSWLRLPGRDRVQLPVHVWITVEGLGTRKLHTPGAGSIGILDETPHAEYSMGRYGSVEVERGTPLILGSRVGQEITQVTRLWQDPPGGEVGFILHFGEGSVAIANLADELTIAPWPDRIWSGWGVSSVNE